MAKLSQMEMPKNIDDDNLTDLIVGFGSIDRIRNNDLQDKFALISAYELVRDDLIQVIPEITSPVEDLKATGQQWAADSTKWKEFVETYYNSDPNYVEALRGWAIGLARDDETEEVGRISSYINQLITDLLQKSGITKERGEQFKTGFVRYMLLFYAQETNLYPIVELGNT